MTSHDGWLERCWTNGSNVELMVSTHPIKNIGYLVYKEKNDV